MRKWKYGNIVMELFTLSNVCMLRIIDSTLKCFFSEVINSFYKFLVNVQYLLNVFVNTWLMLRSKRHRLLLPDLIGVVNVIPSWGSGDSLKVVCQGGPPERLS